MPEVKVGIPSVVEAALIPHLIGWGRARELLYTGETIDAATALRWGLVEHVVEPEALDREVDRIVGALLSAGPLAVRRQKRLMQEWEKLPIDRAIEAGVEAFVRSFDSDEPRRMLAAFAERKRS
jgi:enoyl-CoA hydratase/carnithine racemase